ncbi:MBL fold metallo-hydrolase [Candidatus Micrarchaeota archaeon]|nr:MBL fold metallo-hydrolase [Candidatus Micrarchaeota archaeon]
MEHFVECLGASGEVGRSAFLLQSDKRIMNDYGIKVFDESGLPKYPVHSQIKPEVMILSHGHLDHCGSLPLLYRDSKIQWYGTPPTKDIADILWQDSMKIMGEDIPYEPTHYRKALRQWKPMLYGQTMQIGETQVKTYDAGHIAGSAMVEYDFKDKIFLYTGDFKGEDTYMQKAAKPVKDVDVLMIESTYAKKEHPKRMETEYNFMDEVEMTVEEGGTVLLPAFALGRTQELISIIREHNSEIPVYVDGMGRAITDVYLKYPQYIRDINKFRKDVRSVRMIRSNDDRRNATREPSIIITSAGMMNGGPVLTYLMNLNPKSKIMFTGYCVEGTNGWKLQKHGFVTIDEQDMKVDLPVRYYDFSAHAGRSDILNFIKSANPQKIILVHGDKTQEFAKELVEDFGFDAVAPMIGDRVPIF